MQCAELDMVEYLINKGADTKKQDGGVIMGGVAGAVEGKSPPRID